MRCGRRGFPAGFECIFSPGRVFRSVRAERAARFPVDPLQNRCCRSRDCIRRPDFFTLREWSPRPVPPAKTGAAPILPRTAEVPAPEDATESAIRFYAARVKHDPEDTRSQNAIAEYYLQRVRETGNEDHLPLALEAARASLTAVMAERNIGGLSALAHAEFSNHSFAAARDHALQLIALTPRKSEPYAKKRASISRPRSHFSSPGPTRLTRLSRGVAGSWAKPISRSVTTTPRKIIIALP